MFFPTAFFLFFFFLLLLLFFLFPSKTDSIIFGPSDIIRTMPYLIPSIYSLTKKKATWGLEKAACSTNLLIKNVSKKKKEREREQQHGEKKKNATKKTNQTNKPIGHIALFPCSHPVLSDCPHTIGVEFGTRVVDISNKQIKLQIWDTGKKKKQGTKNNNNNNNNHSNSPLSPSLASFSILAGQVWKSQSLSTISNNNLGDGGEKEKKENSIK